nr:MAG TPA: hypothetical protein [Caudoviricetes sp.]
MWYNICRCYLFGRRSITLLDWGRCRWSYTTF